MITYLVTFTNSHSDREHLAIVKEADLFMFGLSHDVVSMVPMVPVEVDRTSSNCLYGGNAVGHSYGVCTADSCY